MDCPGAPYRHQPPHYRRLPAGVAVERAQAPFRGRLLERRCEDNPTACCGEQPRRRQGPPISRGCTGGLPRLLTAQYVFYPPLPEYLFGVFPFAWGDPPSDAFLRAVEAVDIPLVWQDALEVWAGMAPLTYRRCTAYLKLELRHIPGGVPGAFVTPEQYDTTGPIRSVGQLFVDQWSSTPDGWFWAQWRHDLNGHSDCWPPPRYDWQRPQTVYDCGLVDSWLYQRELSDQAVNFHDAVPFYDAGYGVGGYRWDQTPILNVSCDPFLVEFGFGLWAWTLYNQYGVEITPALPWEADRRPHHSALVPERSAHHASLIVTEATL